MRGSKPARKSSAVPLTTRPMESTERSTQWEPLRTKLVVEVEYDHVTGDRFRHGTRLVRWRPDKSPRQCTFEQLELPARPGRLVKDVLKQAHR